MLENNWWSCLWCNVIFQGINTTKGISHVIITRGLHINSCFSDIDQSHLSIYKNIQLIKSSKRIIINDYLQKSISSVSRLQDKSSEVVDSNIQINYRGMYSSNLTAT